MKGIKRTKQPIEEDEYVPSVTDDDDAESSVDFSGYEEEEEEEDVEEAAYCPTPSPPKPSAKAVKKSTPAPASAGPIVKKSAPPSRKRVKLAITPAMIEDEKEEDEEVGATISTAALKKVVTKKAVPSLIIKKTSSSDYEIHPMDKNCKVTDMSICSPRYPKTKILLDDRYWIRIGLTSYKAKGITYEQILIGRDPARGEVTKDGNAPKPFQMSIPIRCLEPLRRGINLLTSKILTDDSAE